MDEKTAELRDIFTSVTDEETVTESQEAGRGSLEQDERTIEERVRAVIERMRERYEFETSLDTDELMSVVRRFYEDEDDEEIASSLDVSPEAVFEARCSLHLVDESETGAVDLVALREGDDSDADLAERFDCSEEKIRRSRKVADALAESRAANDRYRDEFDSVLADADIADRMASDVRKDGLEDATEGMETDVSF